MRKLLMVTVVAAGAIGLSGCETFDRFEAWKMEALFGVPNPYNAPPGYPYPGQQPMAAPVQPVYVPDGSQGVINGPIMAAPGQPTPAPVFAAPQS